MTIDAEHNINDPVTSRPETRDNHMPEGSVNPKRYILSTFYDGEFQSCTCKTFSTFPIFEFCGFQLLYAEVDRSLSMS